jgi:tetratricopeptide (TPR) repeat protein
VVAPEPSLEEFARVEPPRYPRQRSLRVGNGIDDATQRFERGMERYRRADFAGAIEDLRGAAALDPDAARIRFFLGISHLMVGQDDAAINELAATAALGKSPYLEKAYLYLAKAYLRRNDVALAEAQLKRVIELGGSDRVAARRLLTQLAPPSDATVAQLIAAYYAAYKARDFNALRNVFPAASQLHRSRFEALEKDFASCEYTLTVLEVQRVSDSMARARVGLTESCQSQTRNPQPKVARVGTFELAKGSDGKWIIQNAY